MAYLAAVADRAHKPSSSIPPCPAIMTAPKSMSSSVSGLYQKLAALFPERTSVSQQSSARTSAPPSTGVSAVTPSAISSGPPSVKAVSMDGQGGQYPAGISSGSPPISSTFNG